jgi:hypothetical protein
MDMPNFDDGFDMFAPPTPETPIADSTPTKLCDADERSMLWVFPVALAVSTAISGLLLWGLFRLLK